MLTLFASVESDLQTKSPTMPYSQLLAEVYKTLSERIPLASIVESTSTETALEADLPKSSPSGSSFKTVISKRECEVARMVESLATVVSRREGEGPPIGDCCSDFSSGVLLGRVSDGRRHGVAL